MRYHKLTAEMTGDDGREWLVTIEPPFDRTPEGEPTKWEAKIIPQLMRSEAAEGVSSEPLTYTIPTRDGMFSALHLALNLVP